MGLLLAITAAIGWGAADYYGGDAARRTASVFVVVAASELFGTLLLLPVLVAQGTSPPADLRLLAPAAAAGVAVTIELSLIYRALSLGQAFITSPVGALGAAAAVAVGLITGGPLGPLETAGMACALVGGGLSAWPSPAGDGRKAAGLRSLGIAAGAAAAVAAMLILLHGAARLDPVWTTAVEHTSTAISAAAAALAVPRRGSRLDRPRLGHLPMLGLVAAAGVAGDLAYVSASRHGSLGIVAAISSLYPLTTIALARVRDGRRATMLQAIGAAVALLGAVLLGAGLGGPGSG